MLVCDRVDHEPVRGPSYLIVVFHAIRVRAFPATSPPFSIFVQLTDGRGSPRFDLTIHYLPKDSIEPQFVGTSSFRLAFVDPPIPPIHEAQFLNGVDLPDAGDYLVSLAIGDTILLQRYFVARLTG